MPRPMRIVLVALFVCACRFPFPRALAPGQVTGVFLGERTGDGAKVPLENVHVRLLGTTYLARTDAHGRFVLRNVPSGDHVIEVSRDADGDGRPDDLLTVRTTLTPESTDADDPRNAEDLGTVLLEPAGQVTGRLTLSGEPAVGAAVAVDGAPNVFAVVGADGTFHLPFVAPGKTNLVALVAKDGAIQTTSLGAVDVKSRQTSRLDGAIDGLAPEVHVSGRFRFEDAIRTTPYAELDASLVGPHGAVPLTLSTDGRWEALVDAGLYDLKLGDAATVQPVSVGGLVAYEGAVFPTVYVFDASKGVDSNGDGIPDSQQKDPDDDGFSGDADGFHGDCEGDPDAHLDTNEDGVCDDLDFDADSDGILNPFDNCPSVANPDQADSDGDGVGDACQTKPGVCAGVVCAPHATCGDVGGKGTCTCDPGYTGDATACVALPAGLVTVESAPLPRADGALVFDSDRQELVLVGGGGTSEVWTLPANQSGASWRALDATGGPPPAATSRALYISDFQTVVDLVATPPDTAGQSHLEAWKLDRRTNVWTRGDTGASPVVGDFVARWDPLVGIIDVVDFGAGPQAPVTAYQFDPSPPTADWLTVQTFGGASGLPSGLTAGAAALDPNGVLYVFAGPDSTSQPTADLWSLDTRGGFWTWTKTTVDPASGPPARAFATAAEDGSTMFVFGGLDANGQPLADLWAFDFATKAWTERLPSASPAPRSQGALALATGAAEELFLFGGEGGPGVGPLGDLDELGVGSGVTAPWQTVASPPAGPGSRANAAVAGIDAHRVLVVAGTNVRGAQSDAWMLDTSTAPAKWTAVATSGGGPGARDGARAVYDSGHERVLVFGGTQAPNDLWSLDLAQTPAVWSDTAPGTSLAPNARSGATMAFDSTTDRLLLLGGAGATDADVWSLPLASDPLSADWTALGPTPLRDVGGLSGAGFVPGANGADGQLLAFFGDDPQTVDVESLAFDPTSGATWTPDPAPQAGPTRRAGALVAYEPTRGALYVVGGTAPDGSRTDEVWRFTLLPKPTWTRLCPAGRPSLARAGGALVPTDDGLVLYGGGPSDATQLLSYDSPPCP